MLPSTELIQLIENLIRFRTTASRLEEITKCIEFMRSFFAGTGLTVEVVENNGLPSLVVTKNIKTPKIFLCGHFDVVEADDGAFVPRVEGNRLYGRGAMDMKSGNAVMMTIMKELADTAHSVGLMLTPDEEVGGFNGTKALVESGYRSEIAIIPDGGREPGVIVTKAKGMVWLKIIAEGKSAHGSRPWEGESAIERLTGTLDRVRNVFPVPTAENGFWSTSLNIGKIQGGVALNQVPNSAEATLDIRYVESDLPEDVIDRVRSVLPPYTRLEVIANEPMVYVDLANPLVQAYQNSIQEITGQGAGQTVDFGSSDGRFFTPHQIPVILSQPSGANWHGAGEWVDLDSVATYYDILKGFVVKNG